MGHQLPPARPFWPEAGFGFGQWPRDYDIHDVISKPLHIRETRTVSWITRFSKSLENNFLLRGDNINDDEADNGDDDDNDDDADYDYDDDDDT